ncbi:unnamed protein product [Cylicocyclus nassatus]|uniref:Small EDRK-rich factor-like N-terminal domain-containing protein n=1 Tax=Cylicocyclus nassatus TaxID=53992 RepID=A0AA36M0C1_CYLNA|nr:unnamed protein product [Cylicocyclus nassatus]
MARGPAKIQAQQKAQKKAEAQKKSQPFDHKGAAQKSLIYKCTVCMAQMVNLKSYKQHFESRHPDHPLPQELADLH